MLLENTVFCIYCLSATNNRTKSSRIVLLFLFSYLRWIPLIQTYSEKQLKKQISAQNLSFKRDGVCILSQLSLQIQAGDYLTILGLNGSGKSTLLKLLLGLWQPTMGQIWRNPELRVGYVPQRWHPDPALPIHAEYFLSLSIDTQAKMTAQEKRALVSCSLEEWGLSQCAHQPIHTLSGGQWQRLLMARALIRKPCLLALDEPNQGIDLQGQHQLYQRLSQLNQQGMTIIMISHDMAHAMSYSQNLIALSEGGICCQGTPQELLANPIYQSRFICAHQHIGDDIDHAS